MANRVKRNLSQAENQQNLKRNLRSDSNKAFEVGKTEAVESSVLPNVFLDSQKHKLNRTSSHNCVNLCDHCIHQHGQVLSDFSTFTRVFNLCSLFLFQECCMYIYDDIADISRYAYFKKELDEAYYVTSNSEDFDMMIGNTTPRHFPGNNFELFVSFG